MAYPKTTEGRPEAISKKYEVGDKEVNTVLQEALKDLVQAPNASGNPAVYCHNFSSFKGHFIMQAVCSAG